MVRLPLSRDALVGFFFKSAGAAMIGNFLKNLPDASKAETFETVLARAGAVVQRIVSQGQASPPEFWYEQTWDEWVLLIQGHATLGFEDRQIDLIIGDCLLIPAGRRHRVVRTHESTPTIWLAVHFAGAAEVLSQG